MAKDYDLVVLGSGNAGMAAAGVARAAGQSVAMVESWEVGGTCPLRGCVPKKVLVAAAQALDQIARAGAHEIEVGPARLDWAKLIERVRGFVEGVPESFEKSLAGRGIALVKGPAKFTGRHEIAVNGERLEGRKIVIATGSRPRALDIPGAEHLITSDDLLVRPALPESLIFIGGGVIALEFAHVLARVGAMVTILEAMARILPEMDADAVARIQGESERIGIELVTGASVGEIRPGAGGLEVRFEAGGRERTLSAAAVVNGAGRVADLAGLDLAAAGIDHDGARIAVDDYLRSRSNPDVYVAGDALWSSPQLSPVATYEGRLVGENILHGARRRPSYDDIPANVYTVPALASVGLGVEAARARGLDFTVKENDMTGWRSAMTHAESAAYAKVLIEKDSGKILGAHIVGHGAEEIIHLFAFAVRHGLPASALAEAVYAYPTFTSDVKFMV